MDQMPFCFCTFNTLGLTGPLGIYLSRRGRSQNETTPPWEQNVRFLTLNTTSYASNQVICVLYPNEIFIQVTWLKGNCLTPSTYSDSLKDCTSVVHAVGTLLENPDYKKVVQSKSAAEAFENLRISCKSQNPFKRDADEANNYEKINRDTGIVLILISRERLILSMQGNNNYDPANI